MWSRLLSRYELALTFRSLLDSFVCRRLSDAGLMDDSFGAVINGTYAGALPAVLVRFLFVLGTRDQAGA